MNTGGNPFHSAIHSQSSIHQHNHENIRPVVCIQQLINTASLSPQHISESVSPLPEPSIPVQKPWSNKTRNPNKKTTHRHYRSNTTSPPSTTAALGLVRLGRTLGRF